MNILLVSHKKGTAACISALNPKIITCLSILILSLAGIAGTAGYLVGKSNVSPDEMALSSSWRQAIQSQQSELDMVKRNSEEHMDALAVRLGQLQAHVMRLDGLGQRLTQMAKLDQGEFNFDAIPAQGGLARDLDQMEHVAINDFVEQLQELEAQLADREQQLMALESVLSNQNIALESTPAGRPIQSGWISSYFGMRTDPFNGRRAYHKGMDFAGKLKSGVVAVAAGVVTWSGGRSGYGNMVEISHGNGYVTRYGHNHENLVQVGEKVSQGQKIALMGSSGRSTGPHVHFEVIRNGKEVNPQKFVAMQRPVL